MRFEPSLVQIGRTVRPVALAKKPKKERKKDSGKLAIRPDHSRPTSPYRRQSLHAGWPPLYGSIFQVLLKSVQWFCRCGWSKIALPHYFGHWLIQQLVLPYKPWKNDERISWKNWKLSSLIKLLKIWGKRGIIQQQIYQSRVHNIDELKQHLPHVWHGTDHWWPDHHYGLPYTIWQAIM